MSHDAAVPKDPAPVAEGITVRKPMKYMGTLLSTQTEEVLNADGTNRRMTSVRALIVVGVPGLSGRCWLLLLKVLQLRTQTYEGGVSL
jgi:hypothetical protein